MRPKHNILWVFFWEESPEEGKGKVENMALFHQITDFLVQFPFPSKED
jgi:hypothetical protein